MSNSIADRLAGARAYYQALRNPEHERLDACGQTWVNADEAAEELSPERFAAPVLNTQAFRVGETVPFGGKVIDEIGGMGKILDWRPSPWTPVNGGKIKPLVYIDHIPVLPNRLGISDFIQLRDVLVAQGLMVQNATDREGNVALYTPMNYLCYQARGANQVSCGAEHMHLTVGEEWSKRQLRAAAWLAWLAQRNHDIPVTLGELGPGPGIVKVRRRGHVTHKAVSDAAGFHDRLDPGEGFWGQRSYMVHCVRFYEKHRTMKGA